MNSQIFVQALPAIPHGNMINSVEVGAGRKVPDSDPNQGVPAIIRPYRSDQSDHAQARIDNVPQTKVSGPHHRTNRLDEYVSWLKARVATDKSRIESREPVEADADADQTPLVSHTETTTVSAPRFRIDSAHDQVSRPIVAASNFQTSPDLEKIEGNLTSTSTQDSQPEVGEVSTMDVTVAGQDHAVTHPDADEIIATVSKAIASVLTDRSEADIEAKIRTELSAEDHREALQSLPPEVATQIVKEVHLESEIPSPQTFATDLSDLRTVEMATSVNEATEAASIEPAVTEIHSDKSEALKQEIPTTVAAWDVADFRWPSVTNQMIVTGSEAIGRLVESVSKLMDGTQQRLAVTSSGRGEGSTSIAISVARWAAAKGRRVLLVDADLASPGLSGQVGLGPNISWLNAVNGGLVPAEVTIRSQKSGVCVMPMAPITNRVSWPRYIYDQLGLLTAGIQSNFDLVVFDIGHVSQLSAELSVAGKLLDAALLVHSETGSQQFQIAKEMLQAVGIQKFALAQNSAIQPRANVA